MSERTIERGGAAIGVESPPSSQREDRGEDSVRAVGARFGIDLGEESRRLDGSTAEERVAWVLDQFGGEGVAMTSSFGAQSAVLLHLVTRQMAEVPVILIDTGYLFPETYQFIDELSDRLALNLKVYRSEMSAAWQEARYGKLWEDGLEGIKRYNTINKVEPLNRALEELGIGVWMTGLRRSQSSTRQGLPVLAAASGRVKVHPIVDWNDKDVFRYLKEHDLPYHPLWEKGYVSIGDWHTTSRLADGMKEEDTRFFGLKRECGIHEDSDYVI